jgi:ligand-binding sensor domain-containing protein/serine phosphatase RsbU (regulator of sigma subunit)
MSKLAMHGGGVASCADTVRMEFMVKTKSKYLRMGLKLFICMTFGGVKLQTFRYKRGCLIEVTVKFIRHLALRKLLFLFAVGAYSLAASGQTYDFQNFTVENGLSQSQVLALFQGEDGELWMGTNSGGVNRYNGSGFTYLNKESGLTDNTIFAFAKDGLGRILIGTNNGISVKDGTRMDTVMVSQGLPHSGVHSLLVAKNGTVWVGTRKGVCTLEGLTAKSFTADGNLSSSTVLGLREGTDGSIWFSTVQHGVFRWDGKGLWQCSMQNGLLRNYVFDVMPIGPEEAWLFGYDGLYHLKDGRAELKVIAEVPKGTTFYSYQRDKAGNIWIGTSAGVLKYDGDRYMLLTKTNGLVDNNIWKVLQDREGNLWFASKSIGVSKLNSERFKLYNSAQLPDLKVNAMMRDRNGQMWLGTNKGLVRWDGSGGYVVYDVTESKLTSDIVNSIAQDDAGRIYVGTGYGLTILEGGVFNEVYAEEKELNRIFHVLVVNDGIWLSTQAGVAQLVNGKVTRAANSEEFSNLVFKGCHRGDGLWFAYADGLLHYDGSRLRNLKAADGLTDGQTYSVVSGPDGNLWYGNNDGIHRWNGSKLLRITQKDGLMSNAVYSLAFDADGNLWAGQSKGVCKVMFDGDQLESVIRYGRDQGFLGLDCSANAILIEEPDDIIWLGTSNGLISYDPALDKGEYFRPLTRLTDIRLFSQKVNWGLFTDSVTMDGLPFRLELPYDKNHLTFEFTGVSLTTPNSINYSYILEGFDEEWSPITNNNEATYANLPPGNYVFKLRAGYGNELWANDPVEFRFKVKPPFYLTWWFFVLCAMLAAGVAYSYYTIRRANVQITRQKGEIELQKDIIEKKKDEIEKKNREMLDSINYASTIQSAILPSDELWKECLPDSFVLYQPKDIVSGDFYWLDKRGEQVLFAAVDCTGHGVPGALMSIIGANGLNQAVSEHGLHRPSEILDYLTMSVNESLRKSERSSYVKDGMDIAICNLNLQTRMLRYAGAYNPLVIVRNGEVITIKADRIAIGSMEHTGKLFTDHEVQLEPGDCVYVYSDGFADQFGGPDGKKLKSAPMLKLLAGLQHMSMEQQERYLRDFFLDWKGSLEQVDDICVIGVRV